MGPFASYIHKIISESGYFYRVKPYQNELTSATAFVITGMSVKIKTQVMVNDQFNYLLVASYSKYDYEITDDFINAINSFNLTASPGTKFFYVKNESNIYAMIQLFISGSYPEKKFFMDTLHYSVRSLKEVISKLDEYKSNNWTHVPWRHSSEQQDDLPF